MASPVKSELRDGVAFLILSNPPVNALSQAARQALWEQLDAAESNPEVSEIVLIGEGRCFSAGADISEFGQEPAAPLLFQLCDRVEATTKPVVAAIHGIALGGGFELALAAHYRVALTTARVGLPEVNLGLLPGAGGTQRLPRLTGPSTALEMMLRGQQARADSRALETVFDQLLEDDLPAGALAFCRGLRAGGQGPRPTRDRRDGFSDPMAYSTAIAEARKKATDANEPARAEIISAVEMAQLVPFEAGVAFETDAFRSLLETPQSDALRYQFFAERAAAKLPVPEGTNARQVNKVAVLGGGALATHIVIACLNAGLQTSWAVRDPAHLRDGIRLLGQLYDAAVLQGKISAEARKTRIESLRAGDPHEMVRDIDMAILAAPGQMGVPLPEGAIRARAQPGEVRHLGLRFAPPAYSNRLLEVIAGPEVKPEELAAAQALSAGLGKLPVSVHSAGTSIAGRVFDACARAADALVDLGADIYEVDRAMRAWGWRRAPFEARDGLGLQDASLSERAPGAQNWSRVLVDVGRTGRASGAGFYRYEHGKPIEDAEVQTILSALQWGADALNLSSQQLAWLMIAAMANEGLRILSDGMTRRASDIDVAIVVGHDFPRWRGGPMKAASQYGLLRLSRLMAEMDHPDKALWAPEPAWQDCIKNGRGLDGF